MSNLYKSRFDVATASPIIDLTVYHDSYDIYGTVTLGANWSITATGSLYTGMKLIFDYYATVTLGAFSVSIMGTTMPADYASKKFRAEAVYTGTAWSVRFSPSFDESDIVVTANIKDANITLDKLEALTAASFILGNASNRPTATALTGDVTISALGVMTIGALKISNGNIAAAADIEISKLKGPTGGKVMQTNSVTLLVEESIVTDTQLGYINATPGTAAVSKAVVLTTGKTIDEINVTTLKVGTVAITASSAEINVLAGVTGGTVSASKAVVVDASRQLDYLDIVDLYKDGVQVTSTAAELNKLDALTSVTADLELLAGLAAYGLTAADLQAIKDFNGVISTTSDGVTIASGKFLTTNGGTRRTNILITTDLAVTSLHDIIICSIPATHINLTLPELSTVPEAIYTVIIKHNAAGDDLIITAFGGESVSYAGSEGVAQTLTAVTVNSIIYIINDGSHWSIGV